MSVFPATELHVGDTVDVCYLHESANCISRHTDTVTVVAINPPYFTDHKGFQYHETTIARRHKPN